MQAWFTRHGPAVQWGHASAQTRPADQWVDIFEQLGRRQPGMWPRVKGFSIFRVLERVWIPLVIAIVVGLGGFTVFRIHGIFGSERRPTYSDGTADDSKPFNPKRDVYKRQPFGYMHWLRWFGYTVVGNMVGGLGLVSLLRMVRFKDLLAEERRRVEPNV